VPGWLTATTGATPAPSRLARNFSASIAAHFLLLHLLALQLLLALGLTGAETARQLLHAGDTILLLPSTAIFKLGEIALARSDPRKTATALPTAVSTYGATKRPDLSSGIARGNKPNDRMASGPRRQLTTVLRTNYDFELRLYSYQPHCLDSVVKCLRHRAFLHYAKILQTV
jgi:hypothetical protein